MKKIVFLTIILVFTGLIFAQTPQEKPLTQTEFVKLLNDLQRNPKLRDEIVESVRSRGVSFPVTDGLVGLTRTKSSSDAELIRTLKEAGRRKDNPSAFQLPTAKESELVLEKSREATLAAVQEMPDFVVKQMIQRGISYAGTSNFKNLDKLVVAVSYRSPDISGTNGAEEYRVLSVDGIPADKEKNNYEDVGGSTSYGEFVSNLASLFKTENETYFEPIDTDVIRERKTIVYNYKIDLDKKAGGLLYGKKEGVYTGVKGKVWIDRENFRILRLERISTDIPVDFPMTASRLVIDYDWVIINNERYLLPLLFDSRLTFRQGRESYETRNFTNFKQYQKYGSEVKILDDDVEEQKEEIKKP